MIKIYQGFTIDVKRQRCLAGYPLVYLFVERQSDGWIMVDEFTEAADSVRFIVKCMQARIDRYLLDPSGEEHE